MVRRLVEHQQVRPVGHQEGERRPRPFSGGQRFRRARDVVGTQSELGQQRSGVGHDQARFGHEHFEHRRLADETVPGLLHLADKHIGTEPGLALIGADPAEQQVDQGRLPRTVRTDEGHPLAERELHVDRTESELAAVDDGPCANETRSPLRPARGMSRRSSHGVRGSSTSSSRSIARSVRGPSPPTARSDSGERRGCSCRSRSTSGASPDPGWPIPAPAGPARANCGASCRTRRTAPVRVAVRVHVRRGTRTSHPRIGAPDGCGSRSRPRR